VSVNTPPTARAGGPDSVLEGGTVALDGSASTDPDQTASTLTYDWDLDNDGIYGETGANATHGDEVGQKPTYVATPPPGYLILATDFTFDFALRVTDAGGVSSFDQGTVSVVAVQPTVTITGPGTATPGQPATFALKISPRQDSAQYFFDWGDGTTSSTGAGNIDVTHTYYVAGQHTVSVIANNGRVKSAAATTTVTVSALPDLQLSSEGVLMVSGTSGNDTIRIDSAGGNARVTRNGTTSNFALADVKGVAVDALGGNDTDTVTLNTRTTINGGAGNDTVSDDGAGVQTGAILLGEGDDTLTLKNGFELNVSAAGGDDHITMPGTVGIVDLGSGSNTVDTHSGTIICGAGPDSITVHGASLITSGDGDDHIVCDSNDPDIIDCGNGRDTVSSGNGADRITAGGDPVNRVGAIIDAGGNLDTVVATFADVIKGGAEDDVISVQGANQILGGDGDDRITANQFASTIFGDAGNDRIRANSDAAHPAVVYGGDGGDSINTSSGPDSIYGGAGRDTVHAGDGPDLLSGGGGTDSLFGQGGKDRLYGGDGNDRLEGQGGDDRLFGAAGADLIRGGGGTDTRLDDDPSDLLASIEANQ
jgi:Ca2+-binding RTX toxin-like protein